MQASSATAPAPTGQSAPRKKSVLLQRVLTAVLGIPLIVGIILLGDPLFSIAIAAVTGRAMWEFYALGATSGYQPYRRTGIALGLLILAAAYAGAPVLAMVRLPEGGGIDIQLQGESTGLAMLAALVIAIFATLARAMRSRDLESTLVRWSLTLAGILFVAVVCSFFILLRSQPLGAQWVLLAVFGTFAADIGAYAVGSLLGRHKLSKRISPSKSWEGFVGGVVFAVLAMGFSSQVLAMPYSVLFGFLLGIPIGILGTFGDLAESLMKRSAGAKDAGTLLPGHGGVLDRLDSLGIVTIFMFIVSIWILS